MRRISIALLLSGVLLFSAGCDNDAPADTSGGVSAPTQPAETGARREFVFTRENFPRMDGSTSTVPLAEAAACVLLGEPRESVAELVLFNRTTQSFRNLADGLCDILIVAEPAPEVFEELRERSFEVDIAPIATEALVFVVNASNPVDSLTIEQIQGIYTGRIKNWREVGGDDIDIVPYQRNEEAGSQVLMEKAVMDGLSMLAPPTETQYVAFGMGELMEAIKGFDGSASAIGYTMYYYAEDMRMAEGLKIIAVGGVNPGEVSISSGEYPFLNPYYVVIGADEPEDSPARIMFDWLLSPEGQALVTLEGYVAAR